MRIHTSPNVRRAALSGRTSGRCASWRSFITPTFRFTKTRPYVTRARELIDEQEEAMRGGAHAFGTRIDRGWSPPTVKDVEAEAEDAQKTG